MEAAAVSGNVLGPLTRGGNQSKLNGDDMEELLDLRRTQNSLRLEPLTQLYNARFPYPRLDGISRRSVSRYLQQRQITRKQSSQIPIGMNPVAQLQWLDDLSWIETLWMIDFDENSLARDKIRNKYAWSLVGQPAPVQQYQITLLGYSYSCMSAYTPFWVYSLESYFRYHQQYRGRKFSARGLGSHHDRKQFSDPGQCIQSLHPSC